MTNPCPNLTDQRSYPESHSSIIANLSPRTSPLPTSGPGLVAASSDEGSLKASSREDKDTLDLPPVDRPCEANAMATVDVLPQLLPPPPASVMVVEGSSEQEFDAEHRGDPPLNTSHGQLNTI